MAILVAEYFLGLIPKGTHLYNKFIRPETLIDYFKTAGCSLIDLRGISYNPLTEQWSWTSRLHCNYMVTFKKKVSQ
jgi:2-polyprenyl-6-hydroxyphenyl methylase/3-demethylubiquinone-9 3-methyltransferase